MQILRKPPYPLSITYSVPAPDEHYIVVIQDSGKFEDDILEENVTSNSSSEITLTLPYNFSTYDESYSITIYENIAGERADIVVEDNLDISRPYVDSSKLGTTASEVSEYIRYEALARAIIDSVVPGGFYFRKTWMESTGLGNDFISLWTRTYKILKAYENSQLVWDSSENPAALGDWNYLITQDKSAIIKDPVEYIEDFNREEGKPVGTDLGQSDSIGWYDTNDSGYLFSYKPGVSFPQGYDYLFCVETGYKVVPVDIQDATNMLIDDLKCGRLDYHKRYVLNYSTDQYKIQIDKSSLNGTGNILVDKILDKYLMQIYKPGVL